MAMAGRLYPGFWVGRDKVHSSDEELIRDVEHEFPQRYLMVVEVLSCHYCTYVPFL